MIDFRRITLRSLQIMDRRVLNPQYIVNVYRLRRHSAGFFFWEFTRNEGFVRESEPRFKKLEGLPRGDFEGRPLTPDEEFLIFNETPDWHPPEATPEDYYFG
jgi:hypothetical protein